MADEPATKPHSRQLRKRMVLKFLIYTNIFKALLVRGIMVFHGLVTLWRAVETVENVMLWLMALILLPLICETIYRIGKRKGVENDWFLPAFLFYVIMVVPPIWILELDRLDKRTENGDITGIPLALNAQLVVFVLEQSLLLIIIFGRWLVPKPTSSGENISQLLFSFIGKASDMIIFFQLFDEPDIKNDIVLRYILLSVWSLSLIQFTVDFNVSNPSTIPSNKEIVKNVGKAKVSDFSPKKISTGIDKTAVKEKVHIISDGKPISESQQPDSGSLKDITLKNDEQREVTPKRKSFVLLDADKLSTLLTICTQELPYMVTRIYIIATKSITSYSILFFLAKNGLVILMFVYKALSSVFLKMKGWRRKPTPTEIKKEAEIPEDCIAEEIEDIENDLVDLETSEIVDVKKEE